MNDLSVSKSYLFCQKNCFNFNFTCNLVTSETSGQCDSDVTVTRKLTYCAGENWHTSFFFVPTIAQNCLTQQGLSITCTSFGIRWTHISIQQFGGTVGWESKFVFFFRNEHFTFTATDKKFTEMQRNQLFFGFFFFEACFIQQPTIPDVFACSKSGISCYLCTCLYLFFLLLCLLFVLRKQSFLSLNKKQLTLCVLVQARAHIFGGRNGRNKQQPQQQNWRQKWWLQSAFLQGTATSCCQLWKSTLRCQLNCLRSSGSLDSSVAPLSPYHQLTNSPVTSCI